MLKQSRLLGMKVPRVFPALVLMSCLLGCGDSSVDATPDAQPVAAPACPPGVTAVTDIAQLTDADRNNGRVFADLGIVPAGGTFIGDPRIEGPLQVIQQTVSVPRPAGDTGMSSGTTYSPSADGVTVAPGRSPLVVVMPGYGLKHTNYSGYSTVFASHGFVVLGVDTADGGFASTSDHEQEARRTVAAIDWLLAESPVAAHIDATKISVAGHSKGGKVAFWAAALDHRIDLVIGWDPSNAGGPPCFIDPVACNSQPAAPNCNTADGMGTGVLQGMRAESLIIGVPPDRLTNPDPAHNSLNFYRGAPSPATYILLRGGHADFALGNADLQAVAIRASAGWLLTRFLGKTVDTAYLPGGVQFDPDGLVTPPVRTK
jgi:hypothetical protein